MLGSFPSLTEHFLHVRQHAMHSIVSKHYHVEDHRHSVTKPREVGTTVIILTLQRKPREVKSGIKIPASNRQNRVEEQVCPMPETTVTH